MTTTAPSSVGLWRDAPRSSRGPAIAVAASAVIVAAGVGSLVAYVAGVPWWTGAGAAGLALTAWGLLQGRLALAGAGASAENAPGLPRLQNIVIGTAKDLGMAAPQIRTIEDANPNAAVFPAGGGAVVAFTSGALESLSLTELEAVVAHCLRRIRAGGLRGAAWAAALPFVAAKLAPRVGEAADIAAVEVTRYPPALAKAIAAAVPKGGRFGPFWFVGEGPVHDPAEARIAAVLDL